jgi:hypothetical protein
MKDLTTALKLFCQLQSVIHTCDQLSDSVIFKRRLKQMTNAYLKVIETQVIELTDAMGLEEMDNYSEVVRQLDALADTIYIKTDEDEI